MRSGRRLNSAAKTRLAGRERFVVAIQNFQGGFRNALTLAASANFAKNSIFRARPRKFLAPFPPRPRLRRREEKRQSGRGGGGGARGGGRERERGRAGNIPNALAHSSAFRCCRPTRRNAERLPEYQARETAALHCVKFVQPPPSLRGSRLQFRLRKRVPSRGTPARRKLAFFRRRAKKFRSGDTSDRQTRTDDKR